MSTFSIAGLVVLAFVVLVLLVILRRAVNIVQQGQVGVVKRLGEYRHTHEPGLAIILPFVDTLTTVDMREVPVPGDRQDVITKDNVSVTVNATIFTQVVDAKQALFSVKNFDVAIDALARTALRSVIGTMTLDEALSERERINTDVQEQMEVVTDKWGIRISRIEIVEIAPPPQILQALALQKQADQEKRARILESEGLQTSAINVAEGEAQAARGRAEELGLFLVQPQDPVILGVGARVRIEKLGHHAFRDDLADLDPGQMGRSLGQHHHHGILLPHRDEPIVQALLEDRIVEHLPGFIDDDEGRTAILDHPFDAPEEVGQKR